MKYMISYDLITPGRDYQKLYDELELFNAKKVLRSQWVFNRLNTNASNLITHFRKFTDANDRLLIVSLEDSGWASWNVLVNINKV